MATIAIMLLCLIAFLMQGTDWRRSADAWRFYQESGLARLELPAYQADLKARGKPLSKGQGEELVRAMEDDGDFMLRLRSGQVITPSSDQYTAWRSNRTRFEQLRARVFTENYALNGQEPRLVTLFSHMFLHADIMHLSGNMAVLFVVGYTVEAALGPFGFLAVYLLGGLVATLPDLLLQFDGVRLSIGASGAISAIMAAYLVLFGRRRINFFYWLFFFFGTARWPALVILPVWLSNELLQNFVFNRGANVNYMAHFAGLLGGALLVGAYRWRRQGKSAEMVHRHDDEQAIEETRQRAENLVGDMQFAPAALLYRKVFAEHRQKAAHLAADYLRIAFLSRQPELLTDAIRCLLSIAARDPKSADPALLAEALAKAPGTIPGLTAAHWEIVLTRLIDGRQFDAAERILLRLFARPEVRAATLRQAGRLADSLEAGGEVQRAAPIRHLLSSHEKLAPG